MSAPNIAGESANSAQASATPQAPPPLSISLAGANLTFSWPLVDGFSLQSTTNLTLGNWLNVMSPVPQIVGGQWELALPPATNAEAMFYRLMK